jgi:hypothetical protein
MYWLILASVVLFVFVPLAVHEGTAYYVHYQQCGIEFGQKEFLAASPQCRNKWTLDSLGPDQVEACAKAQQALWVWPSVCAASRMWKTNALKLAWELLTDSYWKMLPVLMTCIFMLYWHWAKRGERQFILETARLVNQGNQLAALEAPPQHPRQRTRKPAIHFIEEFDD